MLRYVSQRLKDSAEQTCFHIKNLRSTFSTCHEKTAQELAKNGSARCDKSYNVWSCLDADGRKTGRKNSVVDRDQQVPQIVEIGSQGKKQKQHDFDCYLQNTLLQLSAGVLASLYFGQMICFYSRRRQNMKRWHHMEQILNERTLRQAIESRPYYHVSYVPNHTDQLNQWYNQYQKNSLSAIMPLANVSNDHSDIPMPFTPPSQTIDVKSDVDLAVEDLLATLGSIEFRLGMQNMRADEPKVAVSHLKLATTHKHPEATFNLGVCYELGVGVEKNQKNAMECYRAAASLGHKKAMYNLGVFYVHGRGGLKKNRDAARACFEAADRMGLPQAKRALTLPERPVKQDDEITWKTNDLMANKISAVHQRHETSVI